MYDERRGIIYPGDHNRFFLVILFWALILEIMVIAYQASIGEIEGMIGIIVLTAITVAGIVAIIRKIRKET